MCNEIGVRIGRLREKKGMTQAELAAALGVKRETVAQWETGTRDIKTQNTVKLADFFGVTCDYLLRGIKAENVDVNKELGLSDTAIKLLKMYQFEKNSFKCHPNNISKYPNRKFYVWKIDVVNGMLSEEYKHEKYGWSSFIYNLTEAIDYKIKQKFSKSEKNEETAGAYAWFAQESFYKMLEGIANMFIKKAKEESTNGNSAETE